MDKAVHLGREDFPAHHFVPVDQKVGLYARLPRGIIGDFIGVPLDPFSGIFGQIEALSGLQLQIFVIALVHLLGDGKFLCDQRFLVYLPAVLTQKRDPVFVGTDPCSVRGGTGGHRGQGGGIEIHHQSGAAQQRRGGHADRQLSPWQSGGKNKHSAFSFHIQHLGAVYVPKGRNIHGWGVLLWERMGFD